MSNDPFYDAPDHDEQRFTNLFARVIEEDDGYTVQVKLTNHAEFERSAWGEEIADSLETASAMIAALAEEFSIPQGRISIQIRTQKVTDGTRH
jgi:hypothetical protein